MSAGEFDLIARYFAPLAGPEGLGLKDDAAVLTPPAGQDLVLTTDANVAGVHFLPDEAPDVIARRLLRTNLSDLAAKGARPAGYLLTVALPAETDEAWVARFAAGLGQDQATYGVRLFGGDTVSTTGPVVASIAALGLVPTGAMLRRAGARPGDALYVTGEIGDGAFGLDAAAGKLDGPGGLDPAGVAALAEVYRLPRPPVAFGPVLAASGLATAAADVSDGLVADAGHIAGASGVAIEIEAARVPLSDAGAALVAIDPRRLEQALTGGDDYQILFTAPGDAEARLVALATGENVRVTRIGRVLAGEGAVRVIGGDGAPLQFARGGYAHR